MIILLKAGKKEAFHNALRLVESLDLTSYRDWLIAQLNDLNAQSDLPGS